MKTGGLNLMDCPELKQQWKQGFCVFPQFLSQERVERLREICDRVLEQWLNRLPAASRNAPFANMAYLREPDYFRTNAEDLLELLEFIAAPEILEILTSIASAPLLFNNTQYFFNNPLSPSWEGEWHRDTQFLAPDPELEQKRMQLV
ncbi:MAG TPA: phytanoyl-CoA dioxygenase family protein [Trichocoleus sp.]